MSNELLNSVGHIISITAMVLLVSCFWINMLLVPYLINGVFDPLLGPKKGEEWKGLKSPLVKGYWMFRANEYVRAMYSESFAQKKFGVSSSYLTTKISPVTLALCGLHHGIKLGTYFIAMPTLLIVWVYLTFFA